MITTFGVEAVLGRRLYVREMYYINAASNVYHAYRSRSQAEDWAKWTKDNPDAAELLTEVERLPREDSHE